MSGDCIRCPFHDWKFEGNTGTCVEVVDSNDCVFELTIVFTMETRFLMTRLQRSRGKQESRLSRVLRETTSWWWVRSSKSPSLLLALTNGNDMFIICSFRTIIYRHYHYWTCKVWHHAEHEEPSWKPPLISEIESGQWTYRFASIVSLVIVISILKIRLFVHHNDCDALV